MFCRPARNLSEPALVHGSTVGNHWAKATVTILIIIDIQIGTYFMTRDSYFTFFSFQTLKGKIVINFQLLMLIYLLFSILYSLFKK